MPDMIDVILAKALTPQGQIASAARQARAAVETVENLTNEIERIQQLSRTTLEELNDNLAVVDQAVLGELNDEINKLAFELNVVNGANARVNNIKISYPDGEKVETLQGVVKYYTTIGQNQDGTMTQKAITNALAQGGTGGNANLGPENVGKMVKVGSDGYLTPSEITQEALLNGDIHIEPENPDDTPMNTGILGLNLNYATSTYTPTDDAISATTADFDTYAMYGGRKRCLVDNDGTIVAFYGDNNYTDTPSNGYQVMVYQPKFYYKRTPITTNNINTGEAIRQEIIKISSVLKDGFKIHPLFVDENNQILDYVLLSVYEGSIESSIEDSYKDKSYTNFLQQKLSSVSNAKPISGVYNNLNLATGEILANNRGNRWHLINIQALSAQQMLMMVEYRTPELQSVISKGISDFNYDNTTYDISYAAITGSTTNLGNTTGEATSTNFNDTSTHTETVSGKKSFSYRGIENEYGNTWTLVQGILYSNNNSSLYSPYICNNFNYSTSITNNYTNIPLYLSNNSGWISAFGYNNDYDWLFIPIETNSNANSLGPIGDYMQLISEQNTIRVMAYGCAWGDHANAGIFGSRYIYNPEVRQGRGTNIRLMYIPEKNNVNYVTNINKWKTVLGG